MVIEVTSESTAHVDRGEKMRIYSQIWRSSAYFIFDPDTTVLEGYRLDRSGRHYEAIEPDPRGDFEVTAMGLKLGLRATTYRQYEQLFVRWLDRDGTPLPTAAERLTISSGENVTEGGKETYNVEYKFNNRWSLIGERDEFDDYNAGVKLRVFTSKKKNPDAAPR